MEGTLAGFVSVQKELDAYIKGCISEAEKIIAPYWPISTFIANNGLSGLESLPFAEAMTYAQDLRRSRGYLPLASYQNFFKQGRITETDIEGAISALLPTESRPPAVTLNARSVPASWLYKYWLLHNGEEEVSQPEIALIETVSARLNAVKTFDSTTKQASYLTHTLGDKTFARDGQCVTQVVNKHMMRWCAAFLDEGQAAWSMPGREQGFYRCWKALAGLDGSLRFYTGQSLQGKLQMLPDEAEAALIVLLQELEIPKANWSGYLARHLAQLPGWASIIRWREGHAETMWQQLYPITLGQYLVVRVFYEAALIEAGSYEAKKRSSLAKIFARKGAGSSSAAEPLFSEREQRQNQLIRRIGQLAHTFQMKPTDIENLPVETFETLVLLADKCDYQDQQLIWQEAYERHYRQHLLDELLSNQTGAASPILATPSVQALFCIDGRSEGLRRHLESLSHYATFGVAGFFGIPMLYRPLGSAHSLTLGPALIKPTQLVTEQPKGVNRAAIEQRLSYNSWLYTGRELFHSLRESLLTPFALVEIVGLFFILPLLGKTLLPGAWRQMLARIQKKLTPPIPTQPSFISNPDEMSNEAQVNAVGGMLRAIGLINQFAPLVFLCGHGSETENNPYASALDCGACGGNHGGINAKTAASMLNSGSVRRLLAQKGIVIPAETFFLAGEHNTTTDEICFLNQDELPPGHQAEFERFKSDLYQASEFNALEEWSKLPGTNTSRGTVTKRLQQRAADWAQVRPEWGLARNAAFICGRRSLTTGLNLDNRTFLHSYDQTQDADGTILESILTAPMVVAEWINMQYYLSTIDNHKFGSSTKLLHTVVSQIGVMQGCQSDLLIGLPQQSVMFGDQLYHEPMRLAVIVEASPTRIGSIIARHELLQHLTKNRWITLLAYDSLARTFCQYSAEGEWNEVAPNTKN